MRIWDIPCSQLCNKHLLGEHNELHAIYNIIAQNKEGYSHHPEVIRWIGKLSALRKRHEEQVEEMTHRGMLHMSPLLPPNPIDSSIQHTLITPIAEQIHILKEKPCQCQLEK